jgi:hypothetical protein
MCIELVLVVAGAAALGGGGGGAAGAGRRGTTGAGGGVVGVELALVGPASAPVSTGGSVTTGAMGVAMVAGTNALGGGDAAAGSVTFCEGARRMTASAPSAAMPRATDTRTSPLRERGS